MNTHSPFWEILRNQDFISQEPDRTVPLSRLDDSGRRRRWRPISLYYRVIGLAANKDKEAIQGKSVSQNVPDEPEKSNFMHKH